MRRRASRSSGGSRKSVTGTPNKQIMPNATASSPIKRVSSYPSPSPEKLSAGSLPDSSNLLPLSKSSPLRKKKVMFCHNLTDTKPFLGSTPKKSILKQQLKPVSISAQDEFLSSPIKNNDSGNSPKNLDFWLAGQIARIPPSINNSHEELISFRSLLSGGLVVLKPIDSIKKFEVYATLNFLLKDLIDPKKITILMIYMDDLVRLIKRDLSYLEKDSPEFDRDPFKTRIYVQIVKLITLLLSNAKLGSLFWNVNKDNTDVYKWIINHSCSLILKESISKSLLIANLQLLKEQRLLTKLPNSIQEKILFSVLNFKTFNNSNSLIIEKLSIIKQLISNFPSMMEKNCKSWLPFVFKSLIDSLSTFQNKSLQSITSIFLESCSHYLTSKPFNFEITSNFKTEVSRIQQLDNFNQDTQNSLPSSIPAKETTFQFITKKLLENLTFEHSELIMLIWLSLTLSNFNNSDNLKNSHDSWLRIPIYCANLTDMSHPKDIRAQLAAINAWKSVLYVLANSDDIMQENGVFFKMLSVMLGKRNSFQNEQLDTAITNLSTRMIYAINNSRTTNQTTNSLAMKNFLVKLNEVKQKGAIIESYIAELLPLIFKGKPNQTAGRPGVTNSSSGSLYLVLQTEPLKLKLVEPLTPAMMFYEFDSLWSIFVEKIWKNKDLSQKDKLPSLSGIMGKIRFIINNKNSVSSIDFNEKEENILKKFEQFVDDYTDQVDDVTDPVGKIEYFNRFTVLLKTYFGNKILSNSFSFHENLIAGTYKHKVRTNDVLKFILQQNRTSEYFILEKVMNKFIGSADDSNGLIEEQTNLITFVTNNLESKIFVTDLNDSELESIINVLIKIPNKSIILLSNVFSKILTNDRSSPKRFDKLVESLDIPSWSAANLFNLMASFDSIKGVSATSKNSLKKALFTKLQETLQKFNEKFIIEFFELLPELKLTKTTEYLTEFFVNNNEYFYYHLVDPKDTYQSTTFSLLLKNFKLYITKLFFIQNKGLFKLVELDRLMTHGLNLCHNLILTSERSAPSVIGRKLAHRVMSVYLSIFECFKETGPKKLLVLKDCYEFLNTRYNLSVTVDNSNDIVDGIIDQLKNNIMANFKELLKLSEKDAKNWNSQFDNASTQIIEDQLMEDISRKTIVDQLSTTAEEVNGETTDIVENTISSIEEKQTQVIESTESLEVEKEINVEKLDNGNDDDLTEDERGKDDEQTEDEDIRSDDSIDNLRSDASDEIVLLSRDEFLEGEKDTLVIDEIDMNHQEQHEHEQNKNSIELIDNGTLNKSSIESISDEIEHSEMIKDINTTEIISEEGNIPPSKEIIPDNDNDMLINAEEEFTRNSSIELTADQVIEDDVSHSSHSSPISNAKDFENAETLEIQDSYPPLKTFNQLSNGFKPIDNNTNNNTNYVDEFHDAAEDIILTSEPDEELTQSQNAEVNINVPFSYSSLDSSPLRSRGKKSGRSRQLRESPLPLSSSPLQNRLSKGNNNKRKLTEGIVEQGSRLLGSPKKRTRTSKSIDTNNFNKIDMLLDELEKDELTNELNAQEVYKIETRLLQLMLKLRK